ncbi:hypothetical protein FisN_UnNu046 [Fistulifera solaris]|uniref:Uncharacterized protein n=1 Tax=Fistulifera solaris TaxID=1519565 RepID=A0A1Z5JHN1_FISSO|nr:hypothetical protein FisN_UnNu046 [Fistulifera solaris]|eukprot:GAX13504.1 hypothetical protein FisN_UnNu046 [Fistulifera solaris]
MWRSRLLTFRKTREHWWLWGTTERSTHGIQVAAVAQQVLPHNITIKNNLPKPTFESSVCYGLSPSSLPFFRDSIVYMRRLRPTVVTWLQRAATERLNYRIIPVRGN